MHTDTNLIPNACAFENKMAAPRANAFFPRHARVLIERQVTYPNLREKVASFFELV